MKLIKKMLLLLLVLSLVLSAAACTDDKPGNENNEQGNNDINNNDPGTDGSGDSSEEAIPGVYTITVTNPLGKPLSGVTVYAHEDGEQDYNVCTAPLETDGEGKVTFTLEPDKTYSVQVAGYPEVYTALSGNTPEERYALTSPKVTVALEFRSAYTPRSYKINSLVANFILSDVDGNVYELAELLKDKKMVMINFWFYNCGYCVMEFPALNTAYNNYKDQIEILAVNDVDSVSTVKKFEGDKKLTLDMPLFKVNSQSAVSMSRFPAGGYPTTVIIDRYGVISYIHSGAITSVSAWNEIFEYYVSDSYDGTPYRAD